MASKEEGSDWEYYDEEDGEDYEWEYEEEEEETKAPAPAPAPAKKTDPPKQVKEEPKPNKVEEAPAPRRRERPKIEVEPDPEPPRRERLGRSDRNDIMEQMKKLQEGYQLDVEEEDDDISYSLSEDDDEDDDDAPPKPAKKVNLEDLDLSDLEDMDLLDPFADGPVVVAPKKKDVKNGHKNGEEKKHKKHKKKSRSDNNDEHDKKIHVRSKDPRKIARQFEKGSGPSDKPLRKGPRNGTAEPRKVAPKPPAIEVNKICKICGKEPYVVERLVAEKSWWHKNCFRCKVCNKSLNLDTYASHQGEIYCKVHHKELFMPKVVEKDSMEEIMRKKKNVDFSVYENGHSHEALERHERQQKRMETIVRENKPVELEGVIKSQVDNAKWDGLENLDVGSKFMMFEKQEDKKESSDRYGIMEKLKRLQAGEDVSDLLAEIDDEMGVDEEEEEEDPDDYGLTEVQKKAVHAEKLFSEKTKKEKMMEMRSKELKNLRERLMAGTRDSAVDSFEELNHRKIKKTEVDVRSANAKKFMAMFDKGEIPEGMSASDRITLEKDAELQMMRTKKRGERDFFKKLENGDAKDEAPKEPKLLVGKLKMNGDDVHEDEDPDTATLSKKFSFFEKGASDGKKKSETDPVTSERLHAAKECKASSVLNKFKQMEERAANGEDDYVPTSRSRPTPRKFTPPRKLHSESESGSDYSDSEYTDSDYSESDEYSSDDDYEGTNEEKEYLRAVKDAARAKALRSKFEEWEAQVGEDGGYINLVDENGLPLETASKLKNRFENLAVEPEAPKVLPNPRKFQVKRFKPKEAYEHQMD